MIWVCLKIRYLKIQWFMIMFPLHPRLFCGSIFRDTHMLPNQPNHFFFFQPRYGEFETPRKNRAKEKDWVSQLELGCAGHVGHAKKWAIIGISWRSNQQKWGSYHETLGFMQQKMVIEPTQNWWCHGINIMGIQRNQGVIEGTISQSDRRMSTWQWKCPVDSSLLNGTPMDL